MDLMSLTFGLPLMPLRGLIRLAELIQEQVELETRSPAAVRRHLDEVEEARASGQITDEEADQRVEQILGQMIDQPGPPG
ncbi:Gas vesicle protein G [Streptosporangium subroseum]|uniref:Gas vesicle protein G n=1 Tax=Streptosporangium subroseum TaxID=106412 RepID=A0A239JBF5_9ACTN|nr:gas vesicle protein GvpG [Streptosporangium subroseum]SNT03231.1 Gas vesicle protein G [Streptosporangium subroseum]